MPYRGTCPYCKGWMDYPDRNGPHKCRRCLQVSQAPPLSKTWRGDFLWPVLIGGGLGFGLGWWWLPGVEESLVLAALFAVTAVVLTNLRHFPAMRKRFDQGAGYIGVGVAYLFLGTVTLGTVGLFWWGVWLLFTSGGSGGGSGGVVVPYPRFRGR